MHREGGASDEPAIRFNGLPPARCRGKATASVGVAVMVSMAGTLRDARGEDATEGSGSSPPCQDAYWT